MSDLPQKAALLIAGPTASGKSALALRLAQERNGVIINADALQVYGNLRIITARPTPEEEAATVHRLYGHVAGADDYSVAHWLKDVEAEIVACWRIGLLPIICGGTGLYFKALQEGLADVPEIAPEVREKWRSFDGDLHSELLRRDPKAAVRLNPSDRQRLIRALEVVDGTGRPLSHWQKRGSESAVLNGVTVERRFIDVPREELYARADRRFDEMLAQGALDEVRALPAFDAARPIMKAIGVSELQAHLRGQMSLEQAVTDAKTATRNYIKRQFTWWRGQMKGWGGI